MINPVVYNLLPDMTVASFVSFVPLALVMSMGAARFFGSPLRSVVKVNIAMLLAYFVTGALLSGGLIAYIVLFR